MTIEREQLKVEGGLRTGSRGKEWFCFELNVMISIKSTYRYVTFGIKLTFGGPTTFDLLGQ
jgi:hypothetical protein